MTNKKRFTVDVHMPDYCVCTAEQVEEDLHCQGGDGAPCLVTMTFSTSTEAVARRFVKNRFPEAKIYVRELV